MDLIILKTCEHNQLKDHKYFYKVSIKLILEIFKDISIYNIFENQFTNQGISQRYYLSTVTVIFKKIVNINFYKLSIFEISWALL